MMLETRKKPVRYCFILVQGRSNNHINGFIYWCHYTKSHYDVYMSNRNEFIKNLSKGFCSFNSDQINHLYNYIRKHCGYRSLRVTKASKVSVNTVKRNLKK